MTNDRLPRRGPRRGVSDDTATVAVGILAVLAVLALFALFVFIGGLVFYVAWNVGVVAIVAACGGHVAHITYWTALGASFAIGILRSIFSRSNKD